MEAKLIKTKKDYQEALKLLETVFDAPAKSPEGRQAEFLVTLIDIYEKEHFPIEPPDPIEAIKIRMQDLELKQKDLADIIGDKGKVSQVLNRKRSLSINMIRKLHEALGISANTLIKEYELV